MDSDCDGPRTDPDGPRPNLNATVDTKKPPLNSGFFWWALTGLNRRPLPCKGKSGGFGDLAKPPLMASALGFCMSLVMEGFHRFATNRVLFASWRTRARVHSCGEQTDPRLNSGGRCFGHDRTAGVAGTLRSGSPLGCDGWIQPDRFRSGGLSGHSSPIAVRRRGCNAAGSADPSRYRGHSRRRKRCGSHSVVAETPGLAESAPAMCWAKNYVGNATVAMYNDAMKTITITIPDELDAEAAAEAKRRGISKSELIRRGLATLLPDQDTQPAEDLWHELAGFASKEATAEPGEIDRVVYDS